MGWWADQASARIFDASSYAVKQAYADVSARVSGGSVYAALYPPDRSNGQS